MKFEYSYKDEQDCVAYIKRGMLVVKGENGEAVMIGYAGVYIGVNSFDEYMEEYERKFYPGDKITITF